MTIHELGCTYNFHDGDVEFPIKVDGDNITITYWLAKCMQYPEIKEKYGDKFEDKDYDLYVTMTFHHCSCTTGIEKKFATKKKYNEGKEWVKSTELSLSEFDPELDTYYFGIQKDNSILGEFECEYLRKNAEFQFFAEDVTIESEKLITVTDYGIDYFHTYPHAINTFANQEWDEDWVKKTIDGEKNRVVGGMLYLVATPIGNLTDLSPRAVNVLRKVDIIAAEDTRVTDRLLSMLQIPQEKSISYHEHNKRDMGEIIVNKLQAGMSVALVTDAGTPAISDPGEDLVALCAEKNIPVTSIPGPVASINALILSGLPTGRFCFEGFLSCNKSARKKHLEELKSERRTMIFHEAPHKLRNTLADFANTFGMERRISLCRELTKIYEEIFRTTIAGAIEHYNECEPCGEYVLVVEGAKEVTTPAFWSEWDIPTHVNFYVLQGKSKMEAIKKVAKERDVSKNTVYQAVLEDNNKKTK